MRALRACAWFQYLWSHMSPSEFLPTDGPTAALQAGPGVHGAGLQGSGAYGASVPAAARGSLARAAGFLREPASPAAALAEVLVFSLHGMSFALPAAQVVEIVPLDGARFEKMARMAAAGTLGVSGMPLIRLATRLGLAPERGGRGALVLFGAAGKVRATLLLDAPPRRVRASLDLMPAAWRQDFWPCEDLIGGVARLADGTQAALIELPIGVAQPRPVASAPRRDSAHLLVRAGRAEPEAVRVASLRGLTPIDDIHRGPGVVALKPGKRMLLLIGGEGDALAVDEVIGLAPTGRIERAGGARVLATPGGRFRLLEPGETVPAPARAGRMLVAAPEGAGRQGVRDLVRALGHEVSLADDPRAAELASGRFDVVLVDIDAYGAELAGATGVAEPTGGPARVALSATTGAVPPGFAARATIDDPVALIAALLPLCARLV